MKCGRQLGIRLLHTTRSGCSSAPHLVRLKLTRTILDWLISLEEISVHKEVATWQIRNT
jgi:hypothetical protein